ncbi:hypothetical protein DUI87_11029 [Hirundo rustica rustica]|uniref:Cortactin-binding protein-2 N-terminal domain-containing protein n=1 Tax=Hirundo rustica rustica TaxID=333673 RepID=A0A3M0KFF3_HIRRU|nr:hypothetical protein DUI87_11029 [Hirundo rustica rustica]
MGVEMCVCVCVYLYLSICSLRHYRNEDLTTNSHTNNESTSDTDISFRRTWSKPPSQTQPSKDDWKPAHMQNGPGKILATTLTTYPAKHYRIGGGRRRQQMVEISQYLYCKHSTMTTLTQFKRHLTVPEEAPCSQGMRNLACGQMNINHNQHKNDVQFSPMHISCLGVFTFLAESRLSSHLSYCRIPKGFRDQNLTRSYEAISEGYFSLSNKSAGISEPPANPLLPKRQMQFNLLQNMIEKVETNFRDINHAFQKQQHRKPNQTKAEPAKGERPPQRRGWLQRERKCTNTAERDGRCNPSQYHPQKSKGREKTKSSVKKREDLSRDDLLFLLSVLEGELQAQDEVIGVLKAEKIDLALLEAQYGFVTPKKVLEALQRDAIQTKAEQWQEDIYEKPMGELDKVVEKQKEVHRRMLEQLLMVEKAHRQTLYELEEEKRKHSKYMEKSDEFTNLLEQECERSIQYFLYGNILKTWLRLKKNPKAPILVTERSIADKTIGGDFEWAAVRSAASGQFQMENCPLPSCGRSQLHTP